MVPSKAERIREILRRVDAAPPCGSAAAARQLLDDTLNAVEDEMTPFPFDPAMPRSDGRMYPALDDSEREVLGRPDLRRFRRRQHNTYLGANGAILIREGDGSCVLNKPGSDGRTVDLDEPLPQASIPTRSPR
ncbi:hypothetical protein [Roseomonas chloroacetimidivorans]|uniref:hypothetical protein n=1 Tax=Roseomonas chloroacetimidivorans TaxID=1766656 RepID=UPI003C738DF5